MWRIIATWCMAKEGTLQACEQLRNGMEAGEAVETAARAVEDNPWLHSVGFGGLPNREMQVELDAGFMDGTTMGVGAVGGIHDFANPIAIAKRLSKEADNCILAGQGAEKYAAEEGFVRKNMLTEEAKKRYLAAIAASQKTQAPYQGHDTVGVSALDIHGNLAAGTTTSGLFLKRPGRIGDSPIVGSGFYADSEVGAANATGLGEDLMKGCISYEVVRRIKMGEPVQDACDHAVQELHDKLLRCHRTAGDLSVVAIDRCGNFGAATNIHDFSFVTASDTQELTVYIASSADGHTVIRPADAEWIKSYMQKHSAPLIMNK